MTSQSLISDYHSKQRVNDIGKYSSHITINIFRNLEYNRVQSLNKLRNKETRYSLNNFKFVNS